MYARKDKASWNILDVFRISRVRVDDFSDTEEEAEETAMLNFTLVLTVC